MTRLATAITTLAILTAGLAALPMGAAQTASAPIGFGMEASAIGVQTAAGVAPDYGSFWIGPWTLSSGWGGPDNQLTAMHNAGVTPAIHFYYWGDDISPSCVEDGCWSSLHNTQKDQAGWNLLADQMVDHLNTKMQGDEVVIFVESEFNKNGIQSYEPFDGYMADMMARIHAGYPNAKVVLSFGSWGTQYYQNFDRAGAEADYVGIQGMRGSTRDSATHYDDLFETTVNNAKFVGGLFNKPVFIQDLALSSYPEPDYLSKQANELQQFFDGMDQLKAAGVVAIVYRSWNDAPGMNLANYYGEAERHWGLSWSGTDALKPAGDVWVAGVQAERGNPTVASATVASSFTASFTIAGGSNEWWVEASAQGTAPISKVEASINGGAFTQLTLQSWGAYAKSFHAPSGYAVFRATSTAGDVYTSEPMSWLGGSVPATTSTTSADTTTAPAETTTTTAPSDTTTTAQAPAFDATFTQGNVNEWWVEAYVSASGDISKVEASVNDGAFTELPATSWGSYAKSFHAPAGHIVFRATSVDGQSVDSPVMSWLGGTVPATSTTTTTADTTATTTVDNSTSATTSAPADNATSAPVDNATTTTTTTSGGGGSATTSTASTSNATSAPAPVAFDASFTPTSQGSRRWIKVDVSANEVLDQVQVSINGGAWTTMSGSGGSYSEKVHLGRNTDVQFRAISMDGDIDMSGVISWT